MIVGALKVDHWSHWTKVTGPRRTRIPTSSAAASWVGTCFQDAAIPAFFKEISTTE